MTFDPRVFRALERIAARGRKLIAEGDSRLTSVNASGDTQTQLDVRMDALIYEELSRSGAMREFYSEEQEGAEPSPSDGDGYEFYVDPLDGSKNSFVNWEFGSLFGFCRGPEMVGAAYILYGPRTIMVTADETVSEHVVDDRGARELSKLTIPSANIVVFGGLYEGYFPASLRWLQETLDARPYLVYNPCMVANLHFVLKQGGVYVYPGTQSHPEGKIRLGYEARTAGFIVERAGGMAIDGEQRILERNGLPASRCPLLFGEAPKIQKVLDRRDFGTRGDSRK